MEMRELKKMDADTLRELDALILQMLHDKSDFRPLTPEDAERIIGDANNIVFVVREEGCIVGVGMLVIVNKFRGRYAYVEDMIVDEAFRGRGIGSALMQRLIDAARERGVKTIELSTRPERESANALYKKLGFTQKETNVYRLKL